MGGTVSFTEGECEVEYSSHINLNDFNKIKWIKVFSGTKFAIFL
jgi:hypothetical protein